MGPKRLSDQLLAAWGSSVNPPLTIREQTFFSTRLAYVTSSQWAETQKTQEDNRQNHVLDITTLKYDQNSPEIMNIRGQLIQCVLAFWGTISEEGAGPAAEKLVDELFDKHEAGRLWIFRGVSDYGETSDNEIAGYLYMGRETKNTVAVRNVYTKDAFRGKGVAKELVAAACRWWLLEVDGDKKKQAVTLFVEPENPAALRTYVSSGFWIEEEPWERRGFNGISMGAF
jgi:GNAT superfamily N-acetyltransferase